MNGFTHGISLYRDTLLFSLTYNSDADTSTNTRYRQVVRAERPAWTVSWRPIWCC